MITMRSILIFILRVVVFFTLSLIKIRLVGSKCKWCDEIKFNPAHRCGRTKREFMIESVKARAYILIITYTIWIICFSTFIFDIGAISINDQKICTDFCNVVENDAINFKTKLVRDRIESYKVNKIKNIRRLVEIYWFRIDTKDDRTDLCKEAPYKYDKCLKIHEKKNQLASNVDAVVFGVSDNGELIIDVIYDHKRPQHPF